VIVFDPSAFPKLGTESVGVARQWCGRLGVNGRLKTSHLWALQNRTVVL